MHTALIIKACYYITAALLYLFLRKTWRWTRSSAEAGSAEGIEDAKCEACNRDVK